MLENGIAGTVLRSLANTLPVRALRANSASVTTTPLGTQMRALTLRSLTLATLFLHALAGQVDAQSALKPSEAQALLQARPDLVLQLRQRLVTSGLTREQVHARLKADGYPEDLLDGYLPGGSGAIAASTDSVFAAVRALGVASDADLLSLRGVLATDVAAGARTQQIDDHLITDPNGYTIFGLDIFRGAGTQFEPNLNGPVDANYRLGPGDRLVLILTGDVEQSYSLDVTREGFIVVPQVGQLSVANLTMGQLESLLSSRLARVYSGVARNGLGSTRFSISVARLRSNQVFVIGEVVHASSYQISSAATAFTALYAAGGPTVSGSLRQIVVRRAQRVVDTLDVYDYLLRGDATHDPRLETGDVLFVPPHGARARIVGEVVRPATYELKYGESLADLLRFAGGLRATAERRHVVIERVLPPGSRTEAGRDRATIDIASTAFVNGVGPAVRIEDNDVVHVLPISDRPRDRVFVVGNVREPGVHALAPGMHVSDALRIAGGVQPDTYLGEILISRLQSDSSRIQLRAMLTDTLNHVANDFLLREDDSLRVFSVAGFRPERYVAIGGSVRAGGRFPYRQGMTLRDLVLLANGLAESAYLKEAEVARLPDDRTGGATATTIRVPLDSTYLFERNGKGEYAGPPGLPAPASGAPDFLLKPYDNVVILRQPNWELQRTVAVSGEVKFPGLYSLTQKTERLSDVIKRAGGLTDEAYAEAAIVSRAQGSVGRVGIDLPTALGNYESSDNLILRDGDSIVLPPYTSLVLVRGQVNQATAVSYVPGRGLDYYVNAAGGAARNGDLDRAYVQQPNGKFEAVHTHFLRPSTMPRPRAGAVVVVPEVNPADKKDFLSATAQIGQILAGLLTLAYLFKK